MNTSLAIFVATASALLLASGKEVPSRVANVSELVATDHFLFSYLDQWIKRINHTMNRIEQEQEGVAASTLSNECFAHMRILLESGHERSPWALKGEYHNSRETCSRFLPLFTGNPSCICSFFRCSGDQASEQRASASRQCLITCAALAEAEREREGTKMMFW